MWLAASGSVAAGAEELPFTRAEDVLKLAPGRAAERLPVHLDGVVIARVASRAIQVHDGERSISIYVDEKFDMAALPVAGRRVRIEGFTDPGKFAPIVFADKIEDLGEGKIPAAEPVALSKLDLVRYDGQWVEISGVVRAAGSSFNRDAMLELASGNGRLLVNLRGVRPGNVRNLIDAAIVVRGLCLHYFNAKGQVYETRLFVPSDESPTIVKAAPADPFELPVRSSASLLRYSYDGVDQHRIRLRGSVTYVETGGWFYLQDQEGSVLVRSTQEGSLAVGDRVDVVGFVSAEGFNPVVDDALFRRTEGVNLIEARLIDVVQAPELDATLVTLEGVLKGVIFGAQRCQLSVEAGSTSFNVYLSHKEVTQAIRRLAVGSRLAVTGVCRVPLEPTMLRTRPWMPTSFTLYARTADDVHVIMAPPMSGATVAITTVLGVGGTALLVLGLWALRARKRLRDQRRQRVVVEAEFAAVLKERNRMAREIHDTIAQGLTSISVQVELARGALGQGGSGVEGAGKHLMLARSFVQDGLAELRRTITGLRPQIMEQCDLVAALRKTAEQLVAGTEITFSFEVMGAPRRMPAYLEDDLLHLGQEAVTNAVRHASALEIAMVLTFQDASVELRVRDDGRGFEQTGTGSQDSRDKMGFGLLGMEERIRQYNGSVNIATGAGRGTEILVRVPAC